MDAQWEQMNQRRIFLLEKERTIGLDAAQTEELACLRKQMNKLLNTRDPLPFDHLSELERKVAEIKVTNE